MAKLELDQADEQGVERASRRQELLGDNGKRLGRGDHPCKGRGLAARTLGMTERGGPLIDRIVRTHGWTKTAPVIPAAA